MMLPNSSGVVRRPWVCRLIWNCVSSLVGRAPIAADRRLHVLLLDRRDDVGRREVQADQPVGVEPDAHRVVERAEQRTPGRRRGMRDSWSSTLIVT